eukprot:COSAG02_NODE_6650_length_3436_cov_3.932673_4_plen_248_part_01
MILTRASGPPLWLVVGLVLLAYCTSSSMNSTSSLISAAVPLSPLPPPVDPVRCSVMCGNVSATGEDWQLCVPGFFQWSLNASAGVDPPSAPLNLKRMEASGRAGASFVVQQAVRGKHYQLFYRQAKSTSYGRSWTFWQRLTAAPPNTSTPADIVGAPPCGPICGDVAYSRAEAVAGRTGFQPFCQPGMLKGELEPFGVQIGPKSPTGLKFPYHLQQLLKMKPGSYGPVEHVLLENERGNGRMLFRQGL